MKSTFTAAVLLSGFLLSSCDRNPYDARLVLRVAELEDSLRAYRDTLGSERMSFNFNTISPVIRLQDLLIRQGDSCRADIFIAGMNADSHGYSFHKPELVLGTDDGSSEGMVIKEHMGRWTVAFKPEELGKDSLFGMIKLRCQACVEPTEVMFSASYTVVP